MPIKKRLAIAVFFVLCAIDRLTKLIALFMSSSTLTMNAKTIFFLDGSAPSMVFLALLVLLLSAWFLHELRTQTNRGMTFAAAFISAGALSNFLDRIRYGAIIDWIPIAGVTVFNLADGFIVIGCALVLFSFFRRKQV